MKAVPLQAPLSGFDETLPAVNEKIERWLAPSALAVVALALLSVLLL
ncbi:MAG: hypothetical protein QM750_11080 [Rubrivivax sp.]